ncbi:MAG: hypothetical protein MUE75_08320 [Algoriphagus sp.]|jgi:hypothetical protein|nr:hypothetical protein [Algoriphagus sp.]
MIKKPLLLYLLFIGLGGFYAKAQDDLVPKDSVEFWKFLTIQKSVPGLGYSWEINKEEDLNKLDSLDGLNYTKTDSGYFSRVFEDFGLVTSQRNQFEKDSIIHSAVFFVFKSPTSLQATQEYVSNLIRNGDFQPVFEERDFTEDLVALAQKFPYSPLLKFKLLFISDFKLFIVTVVIVFFFVVSIGMILFMIILKLKKTNRESQLNEFELMIVDPLTNLLFEKELDEINEMGKKDFYTYFSKEHLSNQMFKEVLIERIISLNKKMKGEFKGKLKLIYQRLELDKVSLALLESTKWHKVTEALVQINEMDLMEALPKVEKLVNSDNFHVRSHSVATLLNLSQKVDLMFLKDQTYPLSDWQQMNYLRIIKFVNTIKPIKIEVLFESKNPSIRIFGIKLVRMLGRVDIIGSLSKMSETATEEEQLEILETFDTLGAHMEIHFINNCILSDNDKVVYYAAKAGATLGNGHTVDLITNRLAERSDSFRTKKQLLRTLHALDASRFDQITLGKVDSTTQELRAHILDPMLSYV